jgi:nitroreductase
MLKELVERSRSYRSFEPNFEISEDTLLDMADIARKCSAAMNTQPLKYRFVTAADEKKALLAITRWATRLGIKLPPEDHEPSAYIVICHDESITPFKPIFMYDIGICAQTLMLAAAEKELGGCIIGSASEEDIKRVLDLRDDLLPKLIIALGKPDEKVVLTEAQNGDAAYYRDENGTHYVPKRALENVVVKK